jgi:hypothetical protein
MPSRFATHLDSLYNRNSLLCNNSYHKHRFGDNVCREIIMISANLLFAQSTSVRLYIDYYDKTISGAGRLGKRCNNPCKI